MDGAGHYVDEGCHEHVCQIKCLKLTLLLVFHLLLCPRALLRFPPLQLFPKSAENVDFREAALWESGSGTASNEVLAQRASNKVVIPLNKH